MLKKHTPAQLTAPSSLPKCSTVSLIQLFTARQSLTSTFVIIAVPHNLSYSVSFLANSVRLRSAKDREAPCNARCLAALRPIPEPAPDIAITRPWNAILYIVWIVVKLPMTLYLSLDALPSKIICLITSKADGILQGSGLATALLGFSIPHLGIAVYLRSYQCF